MWITAVTEETYAPAEAGSSQSARCPPGHSPQTRHVSVTSQQPLKKLTRHVDIFILKNNMHKFFLKKETLLPWTNTLSISTMSSTASPLTVIKRETVR